MQNEALYQLADAMLEGLSVDWGAAESSASDDSTRRVVRDLKVIAKIAEVHRNVRLSSHRPATHSDANDLDRARQSEAVGHEPVRESLPSWSALQLLERVGDGAYGEVYRAWDPRLDREVALKLLRRQDSGSVASLVIDEGRMLAQVRHPNVVTVYGADRSAGRVGLWMEFIHGRTLEQELRGQGPFGAEEATRIGLDLCRALSAVHGAGLLHRDIKAHNVMREDGGRIVLMDFGTGLERAGDSDDSGDGLAGTPLYMAPEILDGRKASVQSDIYSVGVLLHHVVTGSYPVQGRSVQEVRAKHAQGERAFLRDARPDLPETFVQIVEHTLDPQPERRYENAAALAVDLAALKPRPRRVPFALALGVATALMLVVGVVWEIGGRWLGSSMTPSTLLAGLNPIDAANVSRSDRPVIAVLPFKNLSVEPDSDYFVDGLTDEVIRNLSVIDGLAVRSSTSSFSFKNKPRNTREVGELLNANMIVEGSVLREGGTLRINVRFVRVVDDSPLWAGRFDRELKDIFAIQDEISRSIVNELRLKLGRGQRRYETTLEAYDLYLKARVLQARRGAETRQAIDIFQQVVAKDPSFAPALAALASAYGALTVNFPVFGGFAFSPDQAYTIVHHTALQAMQFDPLLAEAHAAMGWVHSLDRQWTKAEESFRQALGLDPSRAATYTDFVLSTLLPEGKFDEALRQLNSALSADPLSLDVRTVMATVQISAGLYDNALDNCRRVVAADPEFPFATGICARALLLKGEVAEGIAMFEKQRNRNDGWLVAYAYAITGRRAEADALATKYADYPQRQAVIYAGLDDKDRAFEAIERLAAVNAGRALTLLNRPELALLRDDPRVAALRKKLGLPK